MEYKLRFGTKQKNTNHITAHSIRFMSDFDEENAEEVGHALDGFGVNLLVTNVARTIVFLETVFGFETLHASRDYALLQFRGHYYQLHADHTYSNNPLLSVIPELGVRGAGVELRLYEVDPDEAENRATAENYTILQSTADKPHGLRECFLLDPDGYCWVPSVKK